MNHHYSDLRALSPHDPLWFDEHAVPRFCEFSPDQTANIYASEAVLFVVECQNCCREFHVCMSWCWSDRTRSGKPMPSLSEQVRNRSLHYGDPPNVECCPAGPTMNSVPRLVLEFWSRTGGDRTWRRAPELEGADMDPDWARE